MKLFDAFRYDGKRVLVVGGASGMGAAAAQLVQDAGAEVVVWDYADVTLDGVKGVHVNLAERDSIDAAREKPLCTGNDQAPDDEQRATETGRPRGYVGHAVRLPLIHTGPSARCVVA